MGIILLLLFSGLLIADPITEGGNVTEANFTGLQNSTNWGAFYGDVVLGAGSTYTVTVYGNNINLQNMVAQNPPCAYTSISMHIIAVNDTGITTPLSAGNLAVLDAFIGNAENGSRTFNSTSTFNLTYGAYSSVPTTYTYANNATSPDFRMGYLNDADGNLVFVADVVSDRPNWNGSTSDYQIMLANNGSPINYTMWVNVIYACPPGGDGDGDDDHILFIHPISTYTVQAGETFIVPVIVENIGDYGEHHVNVHLTCPAGFSCGTAALNTIGIGDSKTANITITAGTVGDYVLRVYADSDATGTYREFLVHVNPECDSDDDCPGGEYCEAGECVPEEPVECEKNADCPLDMVCENEVCREIECACGYVSNHACIKYECCSDADCLITQMCIQHKCVPKELDIIVVDGTLIEGDPLFVQVIDNIGNGIGGANVSTDEMSLLADLNGFATIVTPYSGIIYGEKEGYGKVGKVIDVIRLGFFVLEEKAYAGQETVITLVDSKGNPIPHAQVLIEGGIFTTDGQGRVFYTFKSSGEKIISGEKAGYLIHDGKLMVYEEGAAGEACAFPAIIGLFMFTPGQIYVLWFVALLLAVANFFLFRGRTGTSNAKAFVYSFVPLALAVPEIGIFGICFMSNIVLFQLLVELVLLIKNKVESEIKEAGKEIERGKKRK
jgi:hypothetical protein